MCLRMCVHVPGVPASRRPAAAAARSRRGVPCQAMPRRMLPHRARAQCVCMCVCVWVCCCPGCCIFPHARAVCAAVYSWGQKTDTFTHTHTSRVFQRARACRNILFGSKNRKTKSSWFLTRAVYFQRARACRNIRFGSKNRKTKYSSLLTRAVYFSELELA